MDRCRKEVPGNYQVNGRMVKCFLYEDAEHIAGSKVTSAIYADKED